jgi:hypothetical protein
MTTDKVLAGLKAWIESQASPDLEGVSIYLQDDAAERVPPFLTLSDTGSEEHPVLRGVLKITVEVKLFTVPVETVEDEDDAATDSAGHRAMNAALADILGDTASIQFLCAQDGLTCFDVRGTAPTWEPEDDMRATTFKLEVVACPR